MFRVHKMPDMSWNVQDYFDVMNQGTEDCEEMTGNSLKEASEKEYVVRDVQGEPTVVYPNGGMSSHLDVDYSLMPNIHFIEDVVEVLTLGCQEHGGKYPRDNWKKLSTRDNMVHALRHCLTLHGLLMTDGTDEQLMTELTHAVCRLWFLHEQMLRGQHRNTYGMVDNNYSVLGDK